MDPERIGRSFSTDVPGLKQQIIEKSRNREFLIRAALVIGAVGIIGGVIANMLGPPLDANTLIEWRDKNWRELPPEVEQLLDQAELAESVANKALAQALQGISLEDAAELVRNGGSNGIGLVLATALTLEDPGERELLSHYADALHGPSENYGAARDALRDLATREPPRRLANEMYAEVLRRAEDYQGAWRHFRAEIEAFPQTRYAREGEVDALLKLGRLEEVARHFDDPEYRGQLDARTHYKVLIGLERWVQFAVWEGVGAVTRQSPSMVILTLFAGALWFSIVALLGRGWMVRRGWLIYLLAVGSGVLSTYALVGLSVWQDVTFNFQFNGDLANDLIYCISGIGLREELVKLIFFAPFLPVLLRARSSMRALATAGCVGLGFAMQENLVYFAPGVEGAIFIRFITANFLHVALTGILGLALFHFARWPKTRWEEFIATFLLVVLAHGIYDALVGLVPQIAGQYGILWIVLFAVVAMRYFTLAREVREGGPSPVSPLGVFVVGTALLIAAAWIHSCWYLSPKVVMQTVGKPALGLGVLAFLFINQFRGE